MEFKDIETVKKEIKEGEYFLKRISPIHPIEIKRILEDIYELYRDHFSEFLFLQDQYESTRVFNIEYDKDDNIISASLTLHYWDVGEINLKCTGIEVVYKPEDGPQKIIAELPWKVVKLYFNEFLK